MNATVQTLLELGYSKLTTTQICKAAGVSQGALFKHFPSKAALVGATAERVYQNLVQEFMAVFVEVPHANDPLRAGIEALWALYQTRPMHAIYDLQTAARTDPELREAMAPMEVAHRETVRAVGQQLYPNAADTEVFIGILGVIVYAMHGLGLSKLVVADPEQDRVRIDTLVMIAQRFLTEPTH